MIVRVRTGPGKPGKSWNFNIPKSRPGYPGKCSHGKSLKIEILHNINKEFYLFQFTSHNNNMNCCYITDLCKSEVNFVFPDFQVMDFEKMVMGSHGILNGRRCTNPGLF
jgi:hypothetical protein